MKSKEITKKPHGKNPHKSTRKMPKTKVSKIRHSITGMYIDGDNKVALVICNCHNKLYGGVLHQVTDDVINYKDIALLYQHPNADNLVKVEKSKFLVRKYLLLTAQIRKEIIKKIN